MKLLPVPLISSLSMMFASLACLTPSLFIFVAVCLSVFLYFDVIAFCKRFWVFLFTKAIHAWRLPAAIKVLFHDQMSFRSSASILWNLWPTFGNLRFIFFESHIFMKARNQTEPTAQKTRLTFGLNSTKCQWQPKELMPFEDWKKKN